MTTRRDEHRSPSSLRRRAEKRLESDPSRPAGPASLDEAQRLLHELNVHKVELELQNEELRRTQTELDASRARYVDLYDLAPVGYCTLDRQGVVIECNITVTTMLGVARSVLAGQPFTRFVFGDDLDACRSLLRRLFDTGEPQTCELRLVKSDASCVWCHVAATLRPDDAGVPTGRIALSDITAHKQSEEAKARLTEQLEQARKLESVGLLAGGVAHDFNNMLGVILGHAELAIDSIDPTLPAHADLVAIQDAAGRSADLTRQLLAFARRQTVSPRVLDLNAAVAGTLGMLRRLVGENAELRWQPGPELWSVMFDPSQLDQVLANLCANARDAISDTGHITIATRNLAIAGHGIGPEEDRLSGDYVELTVTDDGCGMDKDAQSKAFEPFFTTKALGRGTGLGLATVYGIVKQNDGFIELDSLPSKGTVVRICLPRHRRTSAPVVARTTPLTTPRGKETILLVEDEPAILAIARRMLERQGYNVLAANAPDEAIHIARTHDRAIHLLVTDVIMPKISGATLAKSILTLHPSLKVLFMSGYTADIVARHGVLGEGTSFIQKPFSQQQLAAKVRDTLDAPT